MIERRFIDVNTVTPGGIFLPVKIQVPERMVRFKTPDNSIFSKVVFKVQDLEYNAIQQQTITGWLDGVPNCYQCEYSNLIFIRFTPDEVLNARERIKSMLYHRLVKKLV
jgi:hypothetical protein